MANAGASLNLASNRPDNVGLASNLTDVLRAAPILKQAPNVALTVAKNGGNVVDNAQAVAAVAHARALDLAAQQLMQAERAYRQTGNILPVEAAQAQLNRARRGSPTLGGEIMSGVRGAQRDISGAVSSYGRAATQTQGPAGGSAGGIAPGVTTPQFTGGIQSGTSAMLHTAAQQANPLTLMTTPQHLYRTWMDIYDRHGPGAMVEAMAPSLLGAGVGYFMTRSSSGAGEGGALGADLVAGTEDTSGAGATTVQLSDAANSAQRVGQGARTFARAVAKPVTVPVGAVARAGTAIGTSPTFLGANLGGIATQFDPIFKQSWDRTQNGMPKGEIGSFGRLVASIPAALHVPGFEKGSGAYKVLSGSLDGFSNIAILDPIGAAGRTVGLARSAEGLGGPLGRVWGGMAIRSPEDVDRAIKQYQGAKNFVTYAADHSATDILRTFGEDKVPPLLAQKLGAAHTQDEATQVLRDMATSISFTDRTMTMPTLGRYGKMRAEGGQTSLTRRITTPVPTGFQSDKLKFSGREFNMGDPYAVAPLMDWMRENGMPKGIADYWGAQLIETSDPSKWADTLTKSAAWVLSNEARKALGNNELSDELDQILLNNAQETFGGRGAGRRGAMASSASGVDLSPVMAKNHDGELETRIGAVWFTQQGKGIMPNPREMQKVAKQLAGVVDWTTAKGLYAHGQNLRDHLDDVINHKFFQPAALATGGWALRVSSSEVLLNSLRLGPLNFSAAAIARSAAKHDLAIGLIHTDPAALADMDRLDILAQKGIQSSEIANYVGRAGQNLTRNVIAAVRGLLAGAEESLLEGLGKQRYLDAATKLILLHDGFMIPGGVSAIHNAYTVGQDEVSRAYSDIKDHEEQFGSERKMRYAALADQWSWLAPHESGYYSALSGHHGLIARDNYLGRPLAQKLYGYLSSGMSEQEAAGRSVLDAYDILSKIQRDDPALMSYMIRSIGFNPDHMGMDSSAISPLHSWAQTAVEALIGAVKGQHSDIHLPMLEDIANNTVPQTAKDMMAKYQRTIPEADLPKMVPGQRPTLGRGSALQRAASFVHTKALGRIVNYLSREPTFVADFANELKLLETQVKAGAITQDQADVLAQTRAIFKSVRFIHNPQDRMVVEQSLHIAAPFWFAKNQAIRRAGRLFATNPGAFEQYLKINLAVQNMAFQANQHGQNYVVLPGSAVVGTGFSGAVNAAGSIPGKGGVPLFSGILGDSPVGSVPISLSGSTDTLQSVVPWSGNGEAAPGSPLSLAQTLASPSLGPLGAFPTRIIGDFFSGHAKEFTNTMLGPVGSTAPAWTYIFPNSIAQHLVEMGGTMLGTNDFGTQGNSAMLDAIAFLTEEQGGTLKLNQVLQSDWNGVPGNPTVPPPPGQNWADNTWNRAQLLKRAKAIAVTGMFVKALVGAVSPVSVSLQRADLKWSTEYQNYINDKKYKGNYLAALDAFMRDHPDFVPSSVAHSASDAGAGWGETAKDGQWMQDHPDWIRKWPQAAQYFIPPRDNVGPFSEATHLMQISEDLRHERVPIEFLTAIAVAWGNSWLYNGIMPSFDQALKANPGNKYQLYNQLNTVIANYGKRNPLWLEEFNAKTSSTTRQTSFDQLQAMLKDPSVPNSTQKQHLQFLTDDYLHHYVGAKATAGSSAARTELKVEWQQYLQQRAKEWPDVSVAISDLFLHLS